MGWDGMAWPANLAGYNRGRAWQSMAGHGEAFLRNGMGCLLQDKVKKSGMR